MNPALAKVYVFRPITERPRKWARYADGKWVDDDGQPDLAFYTVDRIDFPLAQSVHLPYRSGILWQWSDKKTAYGGNPWHYYVENPEDETGEWWERDAHLNIIAGEEAMHHCAKLHGCANGRGPDIYQMNEWMEQKQLWIRETMELVTPPTKPVCYLCMNSGKGHKLNNLFYNKEKYEYEIQLAQADIDQMTKRIADLREIIPIYNEKITGLTSEIADLEEE